MVTEILADIDGKIYSISIQIESVNIKIPVYVSCLVNFRDPENIGVILEAYRANHLNDINYVNSHKHKFINHFSRLSFPYIDFVPDCIVCFYPLDKNRRKILKCFKEKMTKNFLNVREVDISGNFRKKDARSSVMDYQHTKDDFELTLDQLKKFKNILVIDDVIDKGTTINIFLEMLAENDLLDQEVSVRFVCIYSLQKKMNTINLQEMLNTDPE